MADYLSQFTGSEIDARLAKVPQLETGKQDKLVSGSNIKTVNGQSILGNGNIVVQAGDTDAVKYVAQTLTEEQKAQARANIDAASLEDINDMDFVTAASLPTASASTMGHIYLIGPDENDNYDRYFTQQDGSSYSWVSLGSTQIDLSTYATKSEVDQLEHDVSGNLMTARAKNALMAVFQKVAFIVPDVSAEIDELENALFNLDELVGIEAEYTQGSTVIWSDGVSSLNDLLPGLVVNAVYGDGTRVPVASGYTLSGTLTVGTSTITVEYQGFTDTFTVTVTQYGSKMSYVISDLSVIAYKFETGNATYGWTITDPATNRKHAFLPYGLTKIRNSNGTESNYYGIPIPKSATRITVSITSNTLQVGGYLLKYDGVKLTNAASTISFSAGGYSATIDQTGDSDQWYLVVPIKPASGNISSGQPTALSIEFSNE